ncbi:extracellular solute-binding protein [Paenibacillus doosanensis]|uniref:ABC transporter substrate-binding protein n=1 Tax=Paenibacillus doosanensis TaxID=1229154 RepID=UPI00218045E6|nr:extracellular solute-binding protein [Paenibacillus doosanensis]MCS7462125.1 extracellular solute-binding protein [Paenibacillus doosanensis]
MKLVSRKKAVLLSAVSMALLMSACGAGNEAASDKKNADPKIKLKITWAGSQVRHDATLKALDAYSKLHPNIAFEPDYMGFDTYWTKMGTLSAARNLPDILQIDTNNLLEYAQRGQLMELGSDINMADIDPQLAKVGNVGGKQYAVPIGGNAIALQYDKVMFDKLGIKVPDKGFTWDELIQLARDVKPKLEKGKYLLQDMSVGVNQVEIDKYEIYQAAQGKGLANNAEGKFNIDKDTFVKFNELFAELRKEGIVPPIDVTVANKENDPKLDNLLNGTIMVQRGYAASLGAIDGVKPGEFGLMVAPSAKQSGSFLLPAQFFAVSKDSKYAEEAQKFIDWFINDQEAGKILGLSRGPQVSKKVSDALSPTYSDVEKQQVDLIEKAAPIASPFYSRPKGYGSFASEYNKISQQIGFGKITPEQGYDELKKKWEEIVGK